MPRSKSWSRGRPDAFVLLVGTILLLAACSACPAKEPKLDYSGTTGVSTRLGFSSDVPQVDVIVDGLAAQPFLLDTGSPVTVIDSASYGVSPGIYQSSSLDAFSLRFLNIDCAVLDLFGGELGDVGGIIGADILKHFAFTVHYAEARAWLFDDLAGAPPPVSADTDLPVSAGFSLEGGGLMQVTSTQLMTAYATRIVLSMEIEGLTRRAVLDTGASSVVISTDLYDDLIASRPERPVLSGGTVLTVDGPQDAAFTRVTSLAPSDAYGAGDATLGSVAVMVVHSSGAFDSLAFEVGGGPVDILLGASYLRSFLLTIDYPASRILLQRYLSDAHIDPYEFIGVGFIYATVGSGDVRVEEVLPGSDAESLGVTTGDRILQVGPTDITNVGEVGVHLAVDAARLGDRLPFTFSRDASPTDTYDASILIEDLLPDFE